MNSTPSTSPRLFRFCNTIITFPMIFITGYLFLLSIFGDCMINAYVGYETTVYLTDSPLFQISAILLLLLICVLSNSHPGIMQFLSRYKKGILIAIHIIFAVSMTAVILLVKYQPTAAQAWTLDAAQRLLNGDYSFWEHSGFNYIYPALNGLTLYLLPFVSLFGTDGAAIAYQLFNLAMLLLASRSLYGFCRETHLNAGKTALTFIVYLPIGFYIFFIYGNIASLSLSLFSIWRFTRFLSSSNKKEILLSAFTIALAISFKETALITLIAMMIILVLEGIISKQWKKFLWLPLFLVMYFLLSFATDITIEGITGETIPPARGYGHLTMGISEGDRANGWYNDYILDTLSSCNFDYDQYEAITKKAFLQRLHTLLNDTSYTTNFLTLKTASQWNNPTFQSIWIQQQMLDADSRPHNLLCIDGSPVNMLFYFLFNILQSIILFGSLCYFVFDSKDAPLSTLLPAVIFIGGYLFLLFWEAKAQYTILFFILLIPYGISGFQALLHNLILLKDNHKWYTSKVILFLGILTTILLLTAADTPLLKDTIKLGSNDADAYYTYYLEQNVYQRK